MKNKTRKSKKILMVAAIALMVALVAAMGTMTYSKYVMSSEEEVSQATAAKWGFALSADTADFLGKEYKLDGGSAKPVAVGNGVAVVANNIVVAPGTSGSMTITISGTAEVRAQFTLGIKAGYTEISATPDGGVAYKPVKWTLVKNDGSPSTLVDGSEDFADVATAIATANTIEANEACSTTYTLSWAWALETGADAAEKAANNKHDTAIGMYANEANLTKVNAATGNTYTAINPSFGFTLTASIEQIQ